VDAVLSEPVSIDFPVKQGINREFSQNHPSMRPIGPSNRLVSLAFWAKFPKHRNREYFQRNREFNPWNRELSGWIREPSHGFSAGESACSSTLREPMLLESSLTGVVTDLRV
jgi:hypothetical protein